MKFSPQYRNNKNALFGTEDECRHAAGCAAAVGARGGPGGRGRGDPDQRRARGGGQLVRRQLVGSGAQRHEAIENYTRRLGAGEQLDAMEMEMNSNHFTSLNRLQKEAEIDLQQKRSMCLKQVEFVTEAMREVKITDRLRETQKERHRLEISRQEQNEVDEHVSGAFARRIIEAK